VYVCGWLCVCVRERDGLVYHSNCLVTLLDIAIHDDPVLKHTHTHTHKHKHKHKVGEENKRTIEM
jgi:hypothetical protein